MSTYQEEVRAAVYNVLKDSCSKGVLFETAATLENLGMDYLDIATVEIGLEEKFPEINFDESLSRSNTVEEVVQRVLTAVTSADGQMNGKVLS